jgi:hypothetical protein
VAKTGDGRMMCFGLAAEYIDELLDEDGEIWGADIELALEDNVEVEETVSNSETEKLDELDEDEMERVDIIVVEVGDLKSSSGSSESQG